MGIVACDISGIANVAEEKAMLGSSLWYLLVRLERGVNRAFYEWSSFWETRRDLERCAHSGGINIRDDRTRHTCIVHTLLMAVMEHADGVAFSETTLHGVMNIETNDSYWSLNPALPSPELNGTDAELEYLLRYRYMSRINVYHVIKGETVLRAGVPQFIAPGIDALCSFLKIPRNVTISTGDDTVNCRFSLASDTQFRICPMLHVNINYTSG
jgi:hypothetical protein